ncbi:MAG: CoA transferase [Kofleriaceae bacterium]|nr:CoA transferase [Kofleriaceae bacterium]
MANAENPESSPRPLDGIRVLDLSRLLPGPFLTMVLGDMGAEISKVEAPGSGDYLRIMPPLKGEMSGRFLALNRNKRSLVLNLKQENHRDAFLMMVESADVVVETFRPGVMERLGIGFPTLREHNSNIILASISGYGQTGIYRNRAGHDLNYIGLSGLLAMTGEAEEKPTMPGTQVADLAGGALWASTAILGALLGRDRCGAQHLDISMCEGTLALLAAELGNMQCLSERSPTRGSEMLNGALACYSVYKTKDDLYISVGALEPKFWLAFNQAIGRNAHAAEVALDEDHQKRIRDEVAGILVTKTRVDWLEIFAEYDCCAEAVLELDELQDHPLHKSRNAFFTIPDDSGGILQVRTPVGQTTASPPPSHGQHSREILSDFGFSDDEIRRLLVS